MRTITTEQHHEFVERVASDSLLPVSFLQIPAWAAVKPEWRHESIGFFADDELIGTGLILYRKLPRIGRYLAYLPEGPVLPWERDDLPDLLGALVEHARAHHAFAVRIGPTVVWRRWDAATVKAGIADDSMHVLDDVIPTSTNRVGTRVRNCLRHLGWKPPKASNGFAAGQPQYNFALPLTDASGAPRSEADLLKGMNQLWRRNIKKAAKAGVEVVQGTRDDLARFHEVYLVTAERDNFTPRPLEYFQTMWDALNGDSPDRMRVYLAIHEGEVVAATTWIHVGGRTWYSYGASSNTQREVRGSNAVQWRMIQDSLAVGAKFYDLRGITPGLDADDPEIGLIQFKVGTGGEAYSHVGEWDYPINKVLHGAFMAYMERRNR